MKAIELYNIMKNYTEEELKHIDLVIEPNRVYNSGLTAGYYVDKISEMYGQIRLIHMDKWEDKRSERKFKLLKNELENTYPSSKFKIVIEDEIINIIYTDEALHNEKYLVKMFKICEKYLTEDMLFCTKILYDYLGKVKYNE